MKYQNKLMAAVCFKMVSASTLLSVLLVCAQAVSAQTATTFTGLDWSEFSYTKNGMTFAGAQYVCDDADIDNDNDGLIEVCHLDGLDAVRYVLDGSGYKSTVTATTSTEGCGSSGCKGYELVRNLDFDDDQSYRSTANKVAWTAGSGWVPIGDGDAGFTGIFEGNGYTLSNLTINTTTNYIGLFGYLPIRDAAIYGVGLLDVAVRGNLRVGGLVGWNEGTIANSYSHGRVHGDRNVGGLAGNNINGTIVNSYSSGQVIGRNQVGGLVGRNNNGTIRNSYSSSLVNGTHYIGGLVGANYGFIINNYSNGLVSSIGNVAGSLVGWNDRIIANSYSSGSVSGTGNFVGGLAAYNASRGMITNSSIQTIAELQAPTTASNVYNEWSENNWDFGTAIQYPAIKYTTGTRASYLACGTSQQTVCGRLLSGQGRRLVAISTETFIRARADEGETVVLDAARDGNLTYQWAQVEGSGLTLSIINTAELRFFIPNDFVDLDATRETVRFQLTISDGMDTQQTIVSLVVAKVNNGDGMEGTITQNGNDLTASVTALLSDPDGAGDTSNVRDIRYRWQRCLLSEDCSNERAWRNTGGVERSYSVPRAEGNRNDRFRVVVIYTDGQGYSGEVISKPIAYSLSPMFLVPIFTDTDWSRFPNGAKAVCDADDDIDNDDDGLIEICYLEDLDAVRHALDGSGYQPFADVAKITKGCGSGGCKGYELVRDLDFEAEDSYFNAANRVRWTTGTGWVPIGSRDDGFRGIFEGNGHTLSNLAVIPRNRDSALFRVLSSSGVINGVGLLDIDVHGSLPVGGLVAENEGMISNSYSSGLVRGGIDVGGLVGLNKGAITNSYSTVQVRDSEEKVDDAGGLVGRNQGMITNSYSRGVVRSSGSRVGGLVGSSGYSSVSDREGIITNSYSTGPVRGRSRVGGLVGLNAAIILNSYSTAQVNDKSVGDLVGLDHEDGDINNSSSKTTAELQTPTETTGIYSMWSNTAWDFGTTIQYPAIKYIIGRNASYPVCGTSQQPACGTLLAGQRIRQMTISTETSVRVAVVEGEIVVLDAEQEQNNLTYRWHQTGGASLRLETTRSAELRFLVLPNFVDRDALKTTLTFQLTVNDGTTDTQQTTVSVIVEKVNNGDGIWGAITQDGNDLTAPTVASLFDADGAVSISSIRYRWQKCLVGTDCSNERSWSDAGVTTRSYSVAQTEARRNNRFRVVVSYNDGQGYPGEAVASIVYSASLVSLAPTFTGTDWSQFEGGAAAVCDDGDIDNDNDGLIEVCHLEDLDAMRYVLNGSSYQFDADALKSTQGCGSGICRGYELVRDLDFEAESSYLNPANQVRWTTARGWVPIGDDNDSFESIFDGNGHTLSNLKITSGGDYQALFGVLSSSGIINSVGLLNVEVSGSNHIGGLVGLNQGTINHSYSHGRVNGTVKNAGGLVGGNSGTISNSYSTVQVRTNENAGGLVGENEGTISNSYSHGMAHANLRQAAGLVGWNRRGHTIINSYSTGAARGAFAGGLVGVNRGGITNSYSSGQVNGSVGNLVGLEYPVGNIENSSNKTIAELQAPTAATDIYNDWSSMAWDFGVAVQYPTIKYTTGTRVDYLACSTSQQPACGTLLGGQRTRQIAVPTAETETLLRVNAVEGETVVLNADKGQDDLTYRWFQTSGTRVTLSTTHTAELRFVVPSDSVVSETATSASLEFRLTVRVNDSTTEQAVLLIVVSKINNGVSTLALGPISRNKNVLIAPMIDSLPADVDGRGSTSSIRYQWQLCLAQSNCLSDSSDWNDTNGMEASYAVEGAEAKSRNRFRVVIEYSDRQGYPQTVISNPISYSTTAVISFTDGKDWSQFPGGAKAVCEDDDIDNDNDGLIELCYLEDIDEIRYVLDGSGYQFAADAPKNTNGCSFSGCRGYELVRDLDFEAEDSYISTANKIRWARDGWQPIGGFFSGIFEGNGYTLSNLRVNKPADSYVGLFSRLSSRGTINGIGLLDIDVTGSLWTGGLVGQNEGAISNSYSSGQVTAISTLGGLVGGNEGTISNSYSNGQVSGISILGGLVGANSRTISDSYSMAQVSNGNLQAGGLVGWNADEGVITNSYSTGRVTGLSLIGGLVGQSGEQVFNSYWDITKSRMISSAGGTSQTTVGLQAPTSASGIYSTWKTGWDFGTAIQYPAIKYTVAHDINYPACGDSQQPACGSLLGQRIRQVAISTQASVRVDAVEGEMVVLDANRGNFNYSWTQAAGTQLLLSAAQTAELRFVVPSDLVVGETATTGSLSFQLTIEANGNTTEQTVLVVVTKVNNGVGATVLGPVTHPEGGPDLAAPPIASLPDADGPGSLSSIRYQWQRCLSRIRDRCLSESPRWTDIGESTRVYSRQEAEKGQPYRFRVVVNYSDGQAYAERVISGPTIPPIVLSPPGAVAFTATHWSQFAGGAKAVCDDGDIDNDNDGLIELCYLEGLNAIRHVLDGSALQFNSNERRSTSGCGPDGCRGYELVRDLDFTVEDSYFNAAQHQGAWTSGVGWQPIGEAFSGIFEGNGHTISNLVINRPNQQFVGLFLGITGTVNGVGLLDVNVRGQQYVGGLAGFNQGTISNSYSSGFSTSRDIHNGGPGGLIGLNGGQGTISNSYSSGSVNGNADKVGGLVGENDGTISNSYSMGQVVGHFRVGGLVGLIDGGTVRNSYSIGQVMGDARVGGLAGWSVNDGKLSASYWNRVTSDLITSAAGTSKTTIELQSPTSATGIYSSWHDADWDFGTAYQYPAIKYTTGTHADYQACGRSQQPLCGALLGGAGWQIRRVEIATQTFVRVAALEGEAVVLNASQGNFRYSWKQTTGTPLALRATSTSELWFVVPETLVGDATTATLAFELTVSSKGANTMSTRQTVQLVVTKANNGDSPIVLDPIRQKGLVLEAPNVNALPDADGDGILSSIEYQWQKCSTGAACRDWVTVSGDGTNRSYQVPRQEAIAGNRFRVQLSYTDGQGYTGKVFSKESIYSTALSAAILLRLKIFLEGALQ